MKAMTTSDPIKRRGLMLILSSPSGAGKTTLTRDLLQDKTLDLLEYADVHGNSYGTPREPVEKVLSQGRDMLFDIDYQGTQQVQKRAPQDVVTIFILPPSMKELRARLERRAEDEPEVIAKRLVNARNEITRWPIYDYVIVNEDIQTALAEVKSILIAERLKRARSAQGINAFVEKLLGEA
jgi:guanylate kinase